MTGRERFREALAHRVPDRIPFTDAPWDSTLARWRTEGMPDGTSAHDYFGFEEQRFGPDVSLRFEEQTIEQTEAYTVRRDANGAVVKTWTHATSVPEYIDFAVKTPADWHRLPDRARRFTPDRVPEGIGQTVARARQNGRATHFFAHIGFNQAIYMVDMATMLMSMAAEPDWAREVFDFTAEMAVQGAREMIRRGAEFDGAFVADDMGSRNGPMFSPRMYRDLVQPCHARVCAAFAELGLPVILHSCGNIMPLVPDIIDAGVTCLQPLEAKAGMDLLVLKRRYGDRLALMGGIDARTLTDLDRMHHELDTKIPVAMEGGGYILHSDHSIPDDVPLAHFREFLRYGLELGTYP